MIFEQSLSLCELINLITKHIAFHHINSNEIGV